MMKRLVIARRQATIARGALGQFSPHLLSEALEGLGIAALVRLEVLGRGRLRLLGDNRRRWRLIRPADVALGPRVVIEIAVASADVLGRAETREPELRARGEHLAAVAAPPITVPATETD